MAYADDIATFVKWVKWVEEERKNAVSATENTRANSLALQNDIDTLDPGTEGPALVNAIAARLSDQKALKQRAFAAVVPILSRIGRTILSDAVAGGQVIDFAEFFRDWRFYSDNTADDKVTARAVTYASDPAGDAVGYFRRLKLGVGGANDVIESGRHNQTITFELRSKPGIGRASGVIRGATGPIDELDHRAGSGDSVPIEACNDVNPGNAVTNPLWTGNASTADAAPVTAVNSWTLAFTGSAATKFLIETTILWRQRTYTFEADQLLTADTVRLIGDIPVAVLNDRFRPIAISLPFYIITGVLIDVAVTWGDTTQTFTEADGSNGAWVNLIPDMDADLYPYNFDDAVPTYEVLLTGDDSSTNNAYFAGFFAQQGVKHQDIWYFWFSGSSDGDVNDTKTWADTATEAGEIQDTLGFVGDGLDQGWYLNTGGSNFINDPA